MRILLTGAQGQVGWELQRALAPLGNVRATDRRTLDLTNESALRELVKAYAPHLVVNAAAYTAVDAAESDAEGARWLNAEVPRILCEELSRVDGRLVHFSTDYVFDGNATRPYREDDAVAPLGVYGRSKLDGEEAVRASGIEHLILRLAWVYSGRGKNFVRTVRRLARERDELTIVADQVGVPTWARQVAVATAAVLAQKPKGDQWGTYHMAGTGACSWQGFAEEILRLDPDPDTVRARTVRAITTAEYPTPARRPAYSVLDASKLEATFGVRLPSWEEQLALCLAEIGPGGGL